jgi:hypothetical protein
MFVDCERARAQLQGDRFGGLMVADAVWSILRNTPCSAVTPPDLQDRGSPSAE